MSSYYSENEPYRQFPPPPPARRPDQTPVLGCLLAVVLVVVVLLPLALVAGWYWWPRHRASSADAQPRPVEPRGDLMQIENTNIDIYNQVSPSVVHVTNLVEHSSPFTLNVQRVPRGTGSGFVWDDDGHIVTNYHVVEGANAATVTLADHTTYDATRVWAYADKDIAVISVNAPRGKLHRMPKIGSSHDLKVGQVTYAIGNPFGLDQTLTTGIVSALGREIEGDSDHAPIQGVIQTSAAINPGNSGGPLLDSSGRLIGMNTAILSPSGTFAGIGFAIPVDEINHIVPQLIANEGKIVHPGLGVDWVPDQQTRRVGIDGALILRVRPNGPAAKAGLKGTYRDARGRIHFGDVVVAVNGQPVRNSVEVQDALDKFKVDDKVTVTIERNGEQQDVQVQLTGMQ
jgi:S1-C subfamily serine protease